MGLMDYNARFYDPYLNHFAQPDSIVPDPLNPQAWNRYSYALNNPIRYNDPTGHTWEPPTEPIKIANISSWPGWAQFITSLIVAPVGLVVEDGKIRTQNAAEGIANLSPVGTAITPAKSAAASTLKTVGTYLDDVPWKSIVPSKYHETVEGAFKGTPNVVELNSDLVVYRRFGGTSVAEGSPWFSPIPYTYPGNARRYLALTNGNTAKELAEFKILKGTKILVGPAESKATGSSLFGPYATGGGTQIYLPDPSWAERIK